MQIIQYIKQWNQAKNEYIEKQEIYRKAIDYKRSVVDWNVLKGATHKSCVTRDKHMCPSFQDIKQTCTKCEFFNDRMYLKKATEDVQMAYLRFMEARDKLKQYSIVDMFKQR